MGKSFFKIIWKMALIKILIGIFLGHLSIEHKKKKIFWEHFINYNNC